MSWQEKEELPIKITTPDQRVFTPLWRRPMKTIEWNGAELSFLGIDGVLVRKERLLARRFPLELYFTGDDHLEELGRFEESLNNRAPCIIEHPYYNTILAQILALNIDNSDGNVSKINCVAIETITDTGLRAVQNPVEIVKLKSVEIADLSETELELTPTVTDTGVFRKDLEKSYKKGVGIITIPEEFQTYTNAFNVANNYVNVITATPIVAMRAAINMLNLPAKFETNVRARIQTLFDTLDELIRTSVGVTSTAAKQLFQIQGTTLMTAMCYAAVTPLTGDYTNASDATEVIDKILAQYKKYIDQLDVFQSPHGGHPDHFIPSAPSLILLNEVVNVTVSNLVSIALNGKMERSIILEHDSNVILLTHRFYGMDDADKHIEKLIETNKFTYRDMLSVRKGTKVVYYI